MDWHQEAEGLLLEEKPLTQHRCIIRSFDGDRTLAFVFEEFRFRSRYSKDPGGWFEMDQEEWEEKLFLSPYLRRKVVKELVDLGLLEAERVRQNDTYRYRLIGEKCLKWVQRAVRLYSDPMSERSRKRRTDYAPQDDPAAETPDETPVEEPADEAEAGLKIASRDEGSEGEKVDAGCENCISTDAIFNDHRCNFSCATDANLHLDICSNWALGSKGLNGLKGGPGARCDDEACTPVPEGTEPARVARRAHSPPGGERRSNGPPALYFPLVQACRKDPMRLGDAERRQFYALAERLEREGIPAERVASCGDWIDGERFPGMHPNPAQFLEKLGEYEIRLAERERSGGVPPKRRGGTAAEQNEAISRERRERLERGEPSQVDQLFAMMRQAKGAHRGAV